MELKFNTKEEAEAKLKELGVGYSLSHKIHCCLSIEGYMRNKGKKSMRGLITEDNGAEWTDAMVRNYLKECLAKGWRVIPIGTCDNFDYQTGCKGHNWTIKKMEDDNANKS